MNKHRIEPARTAEPQHTLQNWLYLRHTAGVSNRTFHALLELFGNIEGIFNASHKQLSAASTETGIKPSAISALSNEERPDINADLSWLNQDSSHHIITLSDPGYPAQLKQLTDAPPLLYVRGDPEYLAQPQLAMVGTRNPTAAGRNTATEFAHHLSDAGITITSGLATGIDGASHEGALRGLAGSIAVVAHGLDIVYPAQHQQLAQNITEHGAVISEMPIGTQLQRGLFPRRNRLISALSLGTLVVEAAQKSGSLITARYALEQNKEVFAIPGSIHNPMARGCHQLIRQGAKLVETASDILEELCISVSQIQKYPKKSESNTQENLNDSPQALDPDHQKLLKCLAYEPTSIDELVLSSNFTAAEVASMLLILELEGAVVSQDGRYTCVN
ncbi:MAG: DNA-protecting protein DprA [Gammaproteobacteria bacterium]|nr:DNA-protecting protein DprA [Gammaproteobacteria bacterium]